MVTDWSLDIGQCWVLGLEIPWISNPQVFAVVADIWQICNLELNLQVLHAGESFWMPSSSDILLLITPGTICIFPVYHTLQKSHTLFSVAPGKICILLEYWFGVPPSLVILVPPWCTLCVYVYTMCVSVHYGVPHGINLLPRCNPAPLTFRSLLPPLQNVLKRPHPGGVLHETAMY